MNKKIFLLLALVAALALVFVACETTEPADTTAPVTDATTEDATTEAPTEDATSDAATEAPTEDAPTEDATTEDATTEDATTEAPTEEVTTEAPTEEVTTEEVTTEPDNYYEVDLTTVTATGSWPQVDVPINGAAVGQPDRHVIALHYGSIVLGEMDLSKYTKVTVTYATPAGELNGSNFDDEYEATGKRVLLLNKLNAVQENSNFEYLPEEDAIITSTIYEKSPIANQMMTVEIDLTDIDYNGEVILSFDARNANNEFGALGYLVYVMGICFE